MNTVTTNIDPAQTGQRCAFVPKETAPVQAAAAFNFNLRPYKFTTVEAAKSEPETGLDKKTELSRFIAFGKSFALPGARANGLY